MRRWGFVGLAVMAIALLAGQAFAYSGNGGVWAMKKGDFYAANFAGTDVGIKAAMDYAGVGGEIKVGAGRFLINSTLVQTYSGQTITGAGDSTVFVNNAAGGDTVWSIYGSNVTLRDFKIDGMAPAATVGQGIMIHQGSGHTLSRLHIIRTPSAAIHIHMGTSKAMVRDCRIESVGKGVAAVSRHGIIFHGHTDGDAIGNYITDCDSNGIWVQAVCKRINLSSNTITFNKKDGIVADPGSSHINIWSNVISNNVSDGVTIDADSSSVSGNLVSANGFFGIWSELAGNANTWVGNTLENNGAYGMGITSKGTPCSSSGWTIASNFFLNNPLPFEIETGIGCSVTNVMFASNYIIGSALNKPLIRLSPNTNSTIFRVHIIGNVLKQGVNHGIAVQPINQVGVNVQELTITENQIFNCAGRGIATWQVGGSASAYITDNLVSGCAGSNEDSLSTVGWTYNGFGKRKVASNIGVFADTLRAPKGVRVGPFAFSGLPSSGDGTVVYCADCSKTTPCAGGGSGAYAFRTNGTWDCYAPSAGGSGDSTGLAYLPGRTNGQVLHGSNQATTGANTYLGLKGFNGAGSALWVLNDDATLSGGNMAMSGGKFTGSDSIRTTRLTVDGIMEVAGSGYVVGPFQHGSIGSFTKLGTSGNITLPAPGNAINFSAVGANTVRATDAAGTLAFSAGGGSNEMTITAGASQVEQKLTVVDSLRVNKKIIGDLGFNVTGDSWVSGNSILGGTATFNSDATAKTKLVVEGDTLRSMGLIRFAQKSGLPQYHIIGSGGSTGNDTLTLVLNGSNNSGQRGPKLMLQRGGANQGVLQGGSLGPEIRWDQATDLILGALGTNTPTFRFDMTSGTSGGLSINKSGVPAQALDVAGAGIFSDSLRADDGLYLGGPRIVRHLSATGALNFDLTGTVCQDLTITVTGAADGDVVTIGVPNGSVTAETQFSAWVSAANTVTVRACRLSGTARDPASGTFRADVWQH